MFKNNPPAQSTSLPQLLYSRQVGLKGTGQFSQGDRSLIGHSYLPNRFKPVENLSNKMFCGTFSKDGDVFLSASQGKHYLVRCWAAMKYLSSFYFSFQIVCYACTIHQEVNSSVLKKSPLVTLVGASWTRPSARMRAPLYTPAGQNQVGSSVIELLAVVCHPRFSDYVFLP